MPHIPLTDITLTHGCGHTPDQHRTIDGLEADLRAARRDGDGWQRAWREAVAACAVFERHANRAGRYATLTDAEHAAVVRCLRDRLTLGDDATLRAALDKLTAGQPTGAV